jgi:class 3 adenylate cyclase
VADVPETKYARLGEDRIAYQVLGDGPVDVVLAPASGEAVDSRWEYPPWASLLRRFGSFCRFIVFDRRGTGGSDPIEAQGVAAWESWADDVEAVLDTVGCERVALLGTTDGGPTAIMFAATRPERTQSLILVNATARFLKDDDYPYGMAHEDLDPAVEFLEDSWGTEALAAFGNPGVDGDTTYAQWYAKSQRTMMSPKQAAAYFRWVQHTDVRPVLSSIRSPTLILHRKQAAWITIDQGRYLAEHIPGARFVAVDGANMAMHVEPNDELLGHIEEFVTRFAAPVDTDRALAAILFTDIVDSTRQAATLGDSRWRNVLDSHDVVARTLIDQHRGRLIKLTGDGVLASFDGPGRAIRCAFALRDALEPLGIEIRAGLHTGEIELRGDDIGGIAVHIAERVHTFAEPGEVLVSETVPRLVTGSGIEFAERGEYELKGVPGTWKLFSVTN